MNNDFPRIITLLRKERMLSQKQAAADLGVSQALLSHYEKGVRECGLDFVCKAADYYDVSTDYLLGRTPRRYSEIPQQNEPPSDGSQLSSSQLINLRLLNDSLGILFDVLVRIGNRRLSLFISNYLMLSVYKLFRRIYSASGKNPQDMFAVDECLYSGYAAAAQEKLYAEIEAVTDARQSERYIKALNAVELDPVKLSQDFPEQAGMLFNVIQHAESNINKL